LILAVCSAGEAGPVVTAALRNQGFPRQRPVTRKCVGGELPGKIVAEQSRRLPYKLMEASANMNTTTDDPARQLVLKDEYVARAKALSTLPEAIRGPLLTSLLAEALAIGIRAETEFFLAAYGDPSGREYWHAQLSEPPLLFKFAYVLAVHVAERADQLEPATIAIIWAFRDAAEAGEDWLRGEIAPLLALENKQRSFETLGKIKVRPRAAVHWLLTKPKCQHLVAASLRSFLQLNQISDQPRSLSKRTADRTTEDYINEMHGQGKRPTIKGLEATAKKAGLRGGRQYLRAAFNKRIGRGRGRPAKAL
jgi:hypothetical protein